MPFKRFFRIFWTFIWRFVLASYVLDFAGQTVLNLVIWDADAESVETIQNRAAWLYLLVPLVSLVSYLFGAAYGLWAVFNAKYKHFDIDVRTDKAADAF